MHITNSFRRPKSPSLLSVLGYPDIPAAYQSPPCTITGYHVSYPFVLELKKHIIVMHKKQRVLFLRSLAVLLRDKTKRNDLENQFILQQKGGKNHVFEKNLTDCQRHIKRGAGCGSCP